MSNALIETIVSEKDSIRNRSIDSLLQNKNKNQLLKLAEELELFRKISSNLYYNNKMIKWDGNRLGIHPSLLGDTR